MTVYSIYNVRQLLIILLYCEIQNSDLVILTSKLGNKAFDERIINYFKLKKIKVFVSKNQGLKIKILRCFNYLYNSMRLNNFLSKNFKNKFISQYIGDDTDMAVLSKFIDKTEIILVEDGTANYTSDEELQKNSYKNKLIKKIAYKIFNIGNVFDYHVYGYDDRIKKIIFTGIKEIPKVLENKKICISLKQLWCSSNIKKKEEINAIFNLHINEFENKIIFLMQPFDISEEDELKCYVNFANKYNKNEIIFKAHPRQKENIVEQLKLKGYYVYSDTLPAELILLNEIKIKKVVTFCSTAAYDFIRYCDVEILGTKELCNINNKIVYFDHKEYLLN